jgi:hypothetical protein
MHRDFENNALWKRIRARAVLRIENHIRSLKRPGTSPEKTEELRGRIDELERLIQLEDKPLEEIETQPTARGTE